MSLGEIGVTTFATFCIPKLCIESALGHKNDNVFVYVCHGGGVLQV